ncbi:Uncharacterised protein [Achromobacter kerstersii]|nr:Uncharacterised protein [Achromobacter kerstersii]
MAFAHRDARGVQVCAQPFGNHHRLGRCAIRQQQRKVRTIQTSQHGGGHVQGLQRALNAFARGAQPLVDEFARHVAVQVGQITLAEHQHMPAALGGRIFQRAPELVDEVLAVGQAGHRVLVKLQLQRFDLGVLFLDAGVHAFARLIQGLHHARQLGHARFNLFGRRVLANAAHVVADFPQQAVLDPAHQHEREHGPQHARAHHQRNHLQAAAPQGFPGVGVVGGERHFTNLAPAVADRVAGRLRVQRRQLLEPGGHRVRRGGGLAFDQHLAIGVRQSHQRKMAAVIQRGQQQFLKHRIVIGGLRQGQRQRYRRVGTLHLQLARQVFTRRVHAERQGTQQDDANRQGHAEQ